MTNQTSDNQAWTTQRLIAFSNALAIAYNLNSADTKATKNSTDNWTTEQLIGISSGLAQAYGSDI